ncbi:hypothetical protein BT93_F1151 [Corymbia citriodora subsp. variegata]|nr:hypothetical protein BT93_F1151 [Corymbia citriodora subsp. variegata]
MVAFSSRGLPSERMVFMTSKWPVRAATWSGVLPQELGLATSWGHSWRTCLMKSPWPNSAARWTRLLRLRVSSLRRSHRGSFRIEFLLRAMKSPSLAALYILEFMYLSGSFTSSIFISSSCSFSSGIAGLIFSVWRKQMELLSWEEEMKDGVACYKISEHRSVSAFPLG